MLGGGESAQQPKSPASSQKAFPGTTQSQRSSGFRRRDTKHQPEFFLTALKLGQQATDIIQEHTFMAREIYSN